MVILIIGLIILGLAVTILVRAFSTPSHAPEVLGQIGVYGYSAKARPFDDAAGTGKRTLSDVAASLGEIVARRQRSERESVLRQRLVSAGWYERTPRQFVGYQLLTGVAICVLWVVLARFGNAKPVLYVVGIAVAALFGWYLPSIVLARATRDRHHKIDRALPELIDLLVVTVEAGIGFVAALRLASEQLDGPLAQELRLTLQEQNMGLSSTEAIQGMLKRTETVGVRSFVRAIVQGETLGVSIGHILRNLADEMRKKRKATAEEQAQKAPIKMLFPLIFLIFPAMFVVLLLPAIISIMNTLGS